LNIIDQYVNQPQCKLHDRVLPVLSNQKMNVYLNEIADVCGIHKSLTYHTARHTFATTVTLANGVPIETVSKMQGHRNLRTTQHSTMRRFWIRILVRIRNFCEINLNEVKASRKILLGTLKKKRIVSRDGLFYLYEVPGSNSDGWRIGSGLQTFTAARIWSDCSTMSD